MKQEQVLVNLTEKQSADYLGVSLSTLRRWRRKGLGPAYFRLGDIIRYPRQALDAFIQQHSIEAA